MWAVTIQSASVRTDVKDVLTRAGQEAILPDFLTRHLSIRYRYTTFEIHRQILGRRMRLEGGVSRDYKVQRELDTRMGHIIWRKRVMGQERLTRKNMSRTGHHRLSVKFRTRGARDPCTFSVMGPGGLPGTTAVPDNDWCMSHLSEAGSEPTIDHIHLPAWHHTCSNLPKL
jgi:hypothetical protein